MTVLIISAADTQSLVDKVNAVQPSGYVPVGGILYKDAVWFQIMQTGEPGGIPYILAETGNDVAFKARADFAATFGASAIGTPLTHAGRIIQAFGSVATATNTAEVVEVIRSRNQAFRASFTTTGLEATQLVTVANTPQVITFNAQALPNAELGTLDNATGVFTIANDFSGMLTLNAQIRRGLAGNTTWAVQIETSPDGVVWTPSPGSSRRILLAAGENNLVRFYDFTTAITAAAGTRVRFTQMVSDASNNTGIVALAAALGGTSAAGFIFSLYSLN